ncbi:MAG: nucleotidyl transferase AbiEii/AbiGii toxin family protein [Nitrospirota bacterium]
MLTIYSDQAHLLISVLPQVAKEPCFALKGGTAINLFVRNMPRLSVDIDLSYLPVEDRGTSLKNIDTAFNNIESNILKAIPGSIINRSNLTGTGYCIRLLISRSDVTIKVEVSPVLRGSVHPAQEKELSANAEKEFGYAKMQLLSFEDLYAGKLCAALDRQHPRDLFDIYYLLNNEGITESIKNTFLVYLISHNRPIAELLAPRAQDISALYESEFKGMTYEDVSLEELCQTRDKIVETIHNGLNENDRQLLLSLKEGKPKWELFAFPQAASLPAVRWKLHNLGKMTSQKRKDALRKLEDVLSRK